MQLDDVQFVTYIQLLAMLQQHGNGIWRHIF